MESSVLISHIALFSHDRKKPEATSHIVEFPNKRVLDFRYDVVQLSTLDWRSFVQIQNPIASALMAKMSIAKEDRVRVELECLRLMASLKLRALKMRLIAGFVETYLRLSVEEQESFSEELRKLAPQEKEKIMTLTNSWEEMGFARGIQEGIKQGIGQGIELATLTLAKQLLIHKLGSLEQEDIMLIDKLPIDNLNQLIKALLDFKSHEDLRTYLMQYCSPN